ncbi:MarC family protein [Aureibacter tunicatorum]|uniref:UPF0056 membrane protein n=1 Tax=Aureibacter tunicatorum TaxID=866807 RepID=A0AAE4BU07_9BACT|nr:MarC family protein [Aureibacter tunicatorum]MDR6240222.1 multiple antibiotic resistance protein [Aureibacter tunicatorum]BDD05897.1 UPF0056 inner membrane protein [Aureibacter tunicatorum]
MDELATFAIGLLTITNPIGNIAIFASMTKDYSLKDSRHIAKVTSIAVFVIMLISIWTGEKLLGFFGIDLPAFESAGGLMLMLLGLSMLQSKGNDMHGTESEKNMKCDKESKTSIAVVPISMPLIVGPATITTLIVATHKFESVLQKSYLSLICLVITALIWLSLYFSSTLNQVLGEAGAKITIRIMGIILTSIAFVMLAKGLKGLFPILNS